MTNANTSPLRFAIKWLSTESVSDSAFEWTLDAIDAGLKMLDLNPELGPFRVIRLSDSAFMSGEIKGRIAKADPICFFDTTEMSYDAIRKMNRYL